MCTLRNYTYIYRYDFGRPLGPIWRWILAWWDSWSVSFLFIVQRCWSRVVCCPLATLLSPFYPNFLVHFGSDFDSFKGYVRLDVKLNYFAPLIFSKFGIELPCRCYQLCQIYDISSRILIQYRAKVCPFPLIWGVTVNCMLWYCTACDLVTADCSVFFLCRFLTSHVADTNIQSSSGMFLLCYLTCTISCACTTCATLLPLIRHNSFTQKLIRIVWTV